MWWSQFYKNMYTQKNFSGGAVDKNRPANARGHRFDPCSRKTPHCMEQLSPCATTTEPVLPSPWATITEAHMPRTHALQWEARRVAPTHLQLEKALTEEQCCLYIYIYPWKKVEGIPWLGLCASTARGTGLIPGWGRKILHAVPCGKK